MAGVPFSGMKPEKINHLLKSHSMPAIAIDISKSPPDLNKALKHYKLLVE